MESVGALSYYDAKSTTRRVRSSRYTKDAPRTMMLVYRLLMELEAEREVRVYVDPERLTVHVSVLRFKGTSNRS